jgi:hypothetical protein
MSLSPSWPKSKPCRCKQQVGRNCYNPEVRAKHVSPCVSIALYISYGITFTDNETTSPQTELRLSVNSHGISLRRKHLLHHFVSFYPYLDPETHKLLMTSSHCQHSTFRRNPKALWNSTYIFWTCRMQFITGYGVVLYTAKTCVNINSKLISEGKLYFCK